MTHGLAVRPFSTAFLATSAAAIITDGFDVLVQLVIDAIATAPWNRSNDRPSVSVVGVHARRRRRDRGRVGRRERLLLGLVDTVGGLGRVRRQVALELLLGPRQLDAVLRALRAGDRRHDGGQVELEVLGEHRLDVAVERGVQPHALLLGVRLDERELLLGATGEAQVVDRHGVDREDRGGRAELGAHVADRGAVGQRHRRDALAVELDELADDAVLAQLLRDREHDVGGGDARAGCCR